MHRKRQPKTVAVPVKHDISCVDAQPPIYGEDLWPWPTLTLDRWPNGYRIFESDIHYPPHSKPPAEGHQTREPYQVVGTKETSDASEAWARLTWSDMGNETVSIMLSPGDHPVIFRDAYFHPTLFSVWRIGPAGLAILVGYFRSEAAKHQAKHLCDQGEQFAVASGYTLNDGGWNDSAIDLDSDVQLSPSLIHLLTLARSGRSSQGSSRCERQSRQIVKCVLENGIGLDAEATTGVAELIAVIQRNPMSGVDAVREAIR